MWRFLHHITLLFPSEHRVAVTLEAKARASRWLAQDQVLSQWPPSPPGPLEQWFAKCGPQASVPLVGNADYPAFRYGIEFSFCRTLNGSDD